MFVKAAINGGREKSQLHQVPMTPIEIADASVRCTALGAAVIHAHARTEDGAQTIEDHYINDMVLAIKNADSNIVVGTTTGLWTCDGHKDRMKKVRSWRNGLKPDFASVAYCEENPDEVAELILEMGMDLESAVWSYDDVPILLSSPFLKENVRILIEPETNDIDEAIRMCLDIAGQFREVTDIPILLHGFEETFWPIVELSIKQGFQTRIGFEDTMHTRDNVAARSNDDLFKSYNELYHELLP